ncbi:ribonuclease P protein component [Thiohalobacter sp. IOR34]|uniref:ribonuclease P protein component n=1 Tax=Thiohalobacter sp. IOR34 TaxID=3057176 RepID=UPI0025B1304F|nr:ribonuclease P protein component [Thiohalobacter sp. IOR34]WJW75506.1 ribonuclease P protein component [Thiohalobacter sp. IOR34]
MRLTRPAQYRQVFAGKLRSADRNMTVLATPNGLAHPRLGLAISRKVSPRAVVRNRIKRQIREVFRQHQAQLAALDFVVIGRPGLRDLPADRLRSSLLYHLNKLSRRSCETSS